MPLNVILCKKWQIAFRELSESDLFVNMKTAAEF